MNPAEFQSQFEKEWLKSGMGGAESNNGGSRGNFTVNDTEMYHESQKNLGLATKEHYAESCRECDGDIRGIDNDWCFKCDKPIKLVLKTI